MLRRLALTAIALGLAGLAGAWVLTRPASLPPATLAALAAHPADATRGEAVFWAAGCASCHTAPDVPATAPVEARLVLAGGRRFATPFGTFAAPNVSMHPEAGIGAWTREQFAAAVLLGVSPGGTHYFPAFPYATYARATPQDVADLWAFWQTLPAATVPSQPHDLGFPFNLRRAVGVWKLLNLDTDFVMTAPADAQIERGRYLVEALGHCAECHTPRDAPGGASDGKLAVGRAQPRRAGAHSGAAAARLVGAGHCQLPAIGLHAVFRCGGGGNGRCRRQHRPDRARGPGGDRGLSRGSQIIAQSVKLLAGAWTGALALTGTG